MRLLISIITLLLLFPSALYGAGTVPVRLAVVETDIALRTVSIGGFVRPVLRWHGASEISGRVDAIKVEPGDSVRRGDVLLVIDNPSLTARLRRAEAALSACETELTRGQNWREAQAELAVAASRRDLAVARVEAAEAEDTHQRKEKLRKRGGMAQHELELAKVTLERAQARVIYLETALALAEKQLAGEDWRADLDKCRTDREMAMAERDEARTFADRRTLKAPFDGQVAVRQVEPGMQVAPGTPLLELLDPSRLRLEGFAAEQDVIRIRSGQTAVVVFADGATSEAVVSHVAPERDATTGGFAVFLKLLTAGPHLGHWAEARVKVEERAGAHFVPRSAVVERSGQSFVFQPVGQSNVEARPVEIGIGEDNRLEIRSGLDLQRMVVVEGAHDLSDGAAIVIVKEDLQ